MFRDYSIDIDTDKKKIIKNTYKNQRQNINFLFNEYLLTKYCRFDKKENFWTLFNRLNDITDLSDPDMSNPNIFHAIQTAEAIRKDGLPDWFVLTGLIHDFGKILFLDGEDKDGTSINTQWAIVGDTFITGYPIPSNIVYPELNNYNQDHNNKINLYMPKCGLNNCSVSFGHDEYLYRLLKFNNTTLPEEALYMIRYHSLYAWHNQNEYIDLESEDDRYYKLYVKQFNLYDLYTKDNDNLIELTDDLKEFYTGLIKKYISSDLMIFY
jgi:inositol oxygenase